MSTTLREATVKARKPHRCAWCHEHIEVGEVHDLWVGIWQGEFGECRMHMECLAAYSRDKDIDPHDGFEPGEQRRGMTIAGTAAWNDPDAPEYPKKA